jgi:hypothetical protein
LVDVHEGGEGNVVVLDRVGYGGMEVAVAVAVAMEGMMDL